MTICEDGPLRSSAGAVRAANGECWFADDSRYRSSKDLSPRKEQPLAQERVAPQHHHLHNVRRTTSHRWPAMDSLHPEIDVKNAEAT